MNSARTCLRSSRCFARTVSHYVRPRSSARGRARPPDWWGASRRCARGLWWQSSAAWDSSRCGSAAHTGSTDSRRWRHDGTGVPGPRSLSNTRASTRSRHLHERRAVRRSSVTRNSAMTEAVGDSRRVATETAQGRAGAGGSGHSVCQTRAPSDLPFGGPKGDHLTTITEARGSCGCRRKEVRARGALETTRNMRQRGRQGPAAHLSELRFAFSPR